MESSVPDPECEMPEEVKDPSDLSRFGLESELGDGLENISIRVLCRLSVGIGLVFASVSVFVLTATAVGSEDTPESLSLTLAAVCELDVEGASRSSRYTTRFSWDIVQN